MKACHGHKFKKINNDYYSEGQFSYELWESRYLRYFDDLFIAARYIESNESNENINISSGDNVTHIDLPDMANMKNRIFKRGQVKKIIKEIIISNNIDIVIVRLPSNNGLKAINIANKLGKKIVIEMVGDPFDALWNHGSYIGKILAVKSYITYKYKMKNLDNIIFVTQSYLQNRYKRNYLDFHTENISNVNISIDPKVSMVKIPNLKPLINKKSISIALIGSYSSKYKGIDTAIKAISILKNKYNLEAKLSILGSGNKERYTSLIKTLDLLDKVQFVGTKASGKKVLSWLDSHDFYVQPSLTEGLPRGLIEAMSRGLPAIATPVGGIPELLEEEVLIKVNDAEGMADKIYKMVRNFNLYKEASVNNYTKAKKYDVRNLQAKRDRFFKKVMEE